MKDHLDDASSGRPADSDFRPARRLSCNHQSDAASLSTTSGFPLVVNTLAQPLSRERHCEAFTKMLKEYLPRKYAPPRRSVLFFTMLSIPSRER
jgi:hypothetical protein